MWFARLFEFIFRVSSRLSRERATATRDSRESVRAPRGGRGAHTLTQLYCITRGDTHRGPRPFMVQVTEPYDPSRPRSAHALQKGGTHGTTNGRPSHTPFLVEKCIGTQVMPFGSVLVRTVGSPGASRTDAMMSR